MVWSESIGQSIVVPGDKDTSNPADMRDYISLGADVPTEIKSFIDAGLFFQNGKYVAGATYMQPKYYGIAAKGTLFFNFVYVENYGNVAGNHKFVNLSSYEFQDDYSLTTTFGPVDANGDPATLESRLHVFNGPMRDGLRSVPMEYTDSMLNTAWFKNFDAAQGDTNFDHLRLSKTVDGWAHMTGLIQFKQTFPAAGAIQMLANPMPFAYCPIRTHWKTAIPNGNPNYTARFDVQLSGNITLPPGRFSDIPNGALVPIDFHWPTVSVGE